FPFSISVWHHAFAGWYDIAYAGQTFIIFITALAVRSMAYPRSSKQVAFIRTIEEHGCFHGHETGLQRMCRWRAAGIYRRLVQGNGTNASSVFLERSQPRFAHDFDVLFRQELFEQHLRQVRFHAPAIAFYASRRVISAHVIEIFFGQTTNGGCLPEINP